MVQKAGSWSSWAEEVGSPWVPGVGGVAVFAHGQSLMAKTAEAPSSWEPQIKGCWASELAVEDRC